MSILLALMISSFVTFLLGIGLFGEVEAGVEQESCPSHGFFHYQLWCLCRGQFYQLQIEQIGAVKMHAHQAPVNTDRFLIFLNFFI